MSDAPESPHPEEQSDQPKKKKSFLIVVLLLLLFVLLLAGGMGYEYGVTVPAFDEAFEAANKLDTQTSSEVVHEAIGKEPTATSDPEKTGGLTIETYSWFSLIPGKSHKFYVTYSVQDGESRILNVVQDAPRELDLADE